MAGGILIVVLLVIVMPVGLMMTGALIAGGLGWTIGDDAERRDDGTWSDLNV